MVKKRVEFYLQTHTEQQGSGVGKLQMCERAICVCLSANCHAEQFADGLVVTKQLGLDAQDTVLDLHTHTHTHTHNRSAAPCHAQRSCKLVTA